MQTDKPTYEELETNAATQAHINLVRIYLRRAAVELLQRGEVHDLSKFSPEEVKVFTEFTPKLKGSTYGSPDYAAFLREMKPALDSHYKNNRHHPEHFTEGISGMNLLDVVEMFFDWLASTKRHADGDIEKSIEINAKRFAMSDQLVDIFRNTARDFGAMGVSDTVQPAAEIRQDRSKPHGFAGQQAHMHHGSDDRSQCERCNPAAVLQDALVQHVKDGGSSQSSFVAGWEKCLAVFRVFK